MCSSKLKNTFIILLYLKSIYNHFKGSWWLKPGWHSCSMHKIIDVGRFLHCSTWENWLKGQYILGQIEFLCSVGSEPISKSGCQLFQNVYKVCDIHSFPKDNMRLTVSTHWWVHLDLKLPRRNSWLVQKCTVFPFIPSMFPIFIQFSYHESWKLAWKIVKNMS